MADDFGADFFEEVADESAITDNAANGSWSSSLSNLMGVFRACGPFLASKGALGLSGCSASGCAIKCLPGDGGRGPSSEAGKAASCMGGGGGWTFCCEPFDAVTLDLKFAIDKPIFTPSAEFPTALVAIVSLPAEAGVVLESGPLELLRSDDGGGGTAGRFCLYNSAKELLSDLDSFVEGIALVEIDEAVGRALSKSPKSAKSEVVSCLTVELWGAGDCPGASEKSSRSAPAGFEETGGRIGAIVGADFEGGPLAAS